MPYLINYVNTYNLAKYSLHFYQIYKHINTYTLLLCTQYYLFCRSFSSLFIHLDLFFLHNIGVLSF